MAETVFPSGILVQGDVQFTGSLLPPLARTALAQQDLARTKIPLMQLRVWDALQTNLPATGAADDLAIVGGTFGTAHPSIQSGDCKATTATRYARFVASLPYTYVAGQTVTLRLSAGMLTTVSDGTATVDVEAYRQDDDTTLTGSDICATAAQSINSLTFANKDFQITPTTLQPGDSIDIRVAIAITDTATATAVIGCIGAIELLADVKG